MLIDDNVIRTSKADVSKTPDDHILIQVHENQDLELEDMKEIHAAKARQASGKLYTVLFIPPICGSVSKEAREFSATKEVNHNAIAKAIVSRSISSRIISDFFIRINRPPAPTKLFSSYEEAVEWLNRMRKLYFEMPHPN